jgi:antitoxin ParD1/3/4
VPSPEKRSFSLPTEQAGYIDTRVASGSYASGSEAVRAGLRALQERDAAVEKWLREEVVGVCDAMQSDPARAIPGEQVFAAVRARHADRMKRSDVSRRVEFSPEALGDSIDLYGCSWASRTAR